MRENNLSNLIIKKIISVNRIFSDTNEGTFRNSRNRWALLIKYEGETVYTNNNKQLISNINNLVLLPKGSSYNWICTKKGNYIVVEFDAELTGNDILTFKIKSAEKILNLFETLYTIWNLKHPFYEIKSINITYDILLKLLDTYNQYQPTEKQEKLRPALDYIAEHYNQPITNEQLAKLLGVSTVYFRKLFTKNIGVSPISYIQNLKIEKAKEMLKSDYSKISVISEAVGFSNIYHFSKTFKQITGISPTEYSKKHNKNAL